LREKTPEFVAAAPFGNVPVLYLEDGTAMYESRAIARFLAVKYSSQGPDLSPEYSKDPKGFALLEQALAVENMKFDPYASSLIYQRLIAP
jgi:glutathione S-transferase